MTRKIPGGHQDADARGATGRRLGIVVSIAILTTLSVLLFGPSGIGVRRAALESLGTSGVRDGAPSDAPSPTRSIGGPILFDSERATDAELSELGRFTRAVFVDDGAVFVDRARVMFVDLDAERVRKVPRAGEGPGEILALRPSVSRVPEGLIVWDDRLRRASSFTQAGEFRRAMALRSVDRRQGFIGALDDSSFVFANGPPFDSMPEGTARHSREVRVVSSNGTSRLVAVVPSREYDHVRDPPMYPLRLIPVIFWPHDPPRGLAGSHSRR